MERDFQLEVVRWLCLGCVVWYCCNCDNSVTVAPSSAAEAEEVREQQQQLASNFLPLVVVGGGGWWRTRRRPRSRP